MASLRSARCSWGVTIAVRVVALVRFLRLFLFCLLFVVDHAVLEQILGALESLRQGLANGFLDDPRAGEPNQRARLGDGDVAQHGE